MRAQDQLDSGVGRAEDTAQNGALSARGQGQECQQAGAERRRHASGRIAAAPADARRGVDGQAPLGASGRITTPSRGSSMPVDARPARSVVAPAT